MNKLVVVEGVESFGFYLDQNNQRVSLGSTDHDMHGWNGMEAVKSAFTAMAQALNIPVVYEDEPFTEMDEL